MTNSKTDAVFATISDDQLDHVSGGEGLLDITLIKFPDFVIPGFNLFSPDKSTTTTTTTNPPPKSGLLGLGILGIL